MDSLSRTDPEISHAIIAETKRQQETINLIASENFTSSAVMAAQGSLLTDKYAEGYSSKRYYGGCENIDTVENLAIARAKELFHCEHVNVQPHSGAQANMAVYFALLKPGDTVLGMSLAQGGHLTHGAPFTYSGKTYNFIGYGVNRETERIDYPELERLVREHQPKLIVSGASAYPRLIEFARLREIADICGAKLMADIAHIAGLVAAGVHPSPVPYADAVTSTTHKTLRGPRGGFIMCRHELAATINSAVFPGIQGGPLMHAIAAKAVCFKEALEPSFADYQRQVQENASALAEELEKPGLRLISGGTDNHMLLVDLTPLDVTGHQAETSLQETGIVINRNAIPFDTLPPRTASGIRLGTPSVTTRGFGVEEMKAIARMIISVIRDIDNPNVKAEVKAAVTQLCQRFPVPNQH
jgi:glycine hydroxymethyltransferase